MMETDITLDYFESAIKQTISLLDSKIPEFVQLLQSSTSTNDLVQTLDSIISFSGSILVYPELELQLKEIIHINTIKHTKEIEPIIYKALIDSQCSSELIERINLLEWNSILDKSLQRILTNLINSEIAASLNIFSYTLHHLKNWGEDKRSKILSWNYKPGYFIEYLEKEIHLLLGFELINKMLDIILDFPDTKSAISDLSDCITKFPELKTRLESQLKSFLVKKIVHCSKATDGILLVYINLTKVMKILFPTMEILESISDPIKKELRKRSDTFKCIIKTIAEDGELYALLDIKQKSVKEQDDFSSDEDELGAFEWQPIPRSALRNVISALNKRSDIVSMLINIYGSQEQFMEEYRTHLSKKLVSNTEFEVNVEIKDLEMLKKRFGEGNLHKCEVMIQDVLSSKRINGFIHEEVKSKSFLSLKNLNFLIISSYFWPIEENEFKFKLPEKLLKSFEEYSDRYNVVKASRKLKFHEQLGSVTLTLEFENGAKTWSGVTPLHAAIITLFDEDSGLKSSEDLSSALGISQHQLRKEISFWETRGVVIRKKQNDEYFYCAAKNVH